MKEFDAYVDLYAVVRVTVKAESADEAEWKLSELIKKWKFEEEYKENIIRELDAGGFLFAVRQGATEEVEE